MDIPLSSRCVTLLVLLATPASLYPQDQQIRFKRLSVSEGLSQSTVNTIAQDSSGFLWFGTQEGLNRYDGYTFRVFTTDPSDTNSIANNYVWKVVAGRNGELWVGTYSGGLDRFDPATEEFHHYRHDPADAHSLSSNSVVALCEDSEGTLWAGTWGSGLNRLRHSSTQFTRFQHDPADTGSLSDDRVSSLLEDRQGFLWVGTWNGLNRFDPRTGRCRRYMHQHAGKGCISDNAVWSLYEDRSGALWIGTWGGGLDRYDSARDQFVNFSNQISPGRHPGTDRVTCMIEDDRGTYWIGTSNQGLRLFDARRQSITSERHDPDDPESLGDDDIMTLFRDRRGGIWCGTFGGGISSYDRMRNQFLHFRHRHGDPGSLSHNVIRAFCEDEKGNLWVGTKGGGVNVLRRGAESFIQHRHRSDDPGSISSDEILSLCRRANGDIWVGTMDCGVSRYIPGEKRFVYYSHDAKDSLSLSNNTVMALFEDHMGVLWLGTNGGGLDRFDEKKHVFIHNARLRIDSISISGNSIWSLAEDSNGDLWVGTWGRGCSRFDRKSGRFISYYPDPSNPYSINNNTVLCVAQGPEGHMWLGTEGGGLNEYDPLSGQFTHITQKEGLPSNVIYGILTDDRGNLWVSTTKGLSRYSPRTGTIQNFDIGDGLQSSEFNQGAYFKTGNGMFCFGGIEGFNMFSPDSVQIDAYPPPVVLTSFKIFDKSLKLSRSIHATSHIVVTHDQSYLSFEFAALDYSAPELNRYAYKLEGYDRDWIDAGTRRYASYARLDGGEYVLRIKGSNKDDVWNNEGISIALTVIPPFWNTWWLRALAAGAFTLVLYVLHRYRVSRLLELERLRVRIASDLHDDIGSSLTRIAAQSEIIRHSDDIKRIKATSTKIGSTSREIIATLGDLVWSIDARNDTVGNLIDRMREYADETLSAEGIQVKFEHKGLLMQKSIPLDTRQNLYLIFKEAVNNTARHSQAQESNIRLACGQGVFTMSIDDDGCGMCEPLKRRGQGLRNMQMRAERINAGLLIENTEGVRIRLTMKEF